MTKDELKAKITEITKENTTEALHAEVLDALVDMIPNVDIMVVPMPNELTRDEDTGVLVLSESERQRIYNYIFGHDIPNEVNEIFSDLENCPKLVLLDKILWAGGEAVDMGYFMAGYANYNDDSAEIVFTKGYANIMISLISI